MLQCSQTTGEVICDVHPQEPGAVDHLHSYVVDEEGSVVGLLLPEVDNDLFRFVHVQDQVVFATSTHKLLHLLPGMIQVVVIPDEAHHCCVVRKLHNVDGGSPWDAVVSQIEQEGAQDAALRGACAEGDDTGGILTDPH